MPVALKRTAHVMLVCLLTMTAAIACLWAPGFFAQTVFAAGSISDDSTAENWTVSDELDISKASLKILKLRYPRVDSPSELAKLIVSIATKAPSSAVYAEWNGQQWAIKGERASVLGQIDFALAPLSMLPKLRAVTSNWIGQVHTPQLKEKIESDLATLLQKRGYLEAKAHVNVKLDSGSAQYLVEFDIGSPCLVRGYKWDDVMPDVSYPKIDSGELCDQELAVANIEAIERVYHDADYLEASFDFSKFTQSGNSSYAYIEVKGSAGDRVQYEFVDSVSGNDASNQLTSSELQNLVPHFTAPDAVPFEIANALKSRGYIDAQVQGPEITHREKLTIYRFTLNRGDAYVVASIKFDGNEAISSGDLSGSIKSDFVPGSLRSEQSSVPYSPDAIQSGLDNMKSQYVKLGFWDVSIADRMSVANTTGTRKVNVSIVVEEGVRRRFDGIEFLGVKNADIDTLKELWTIEAGEPFDRSHIIDFQQKIRSHYAQLGYFYSNVQIDALPSRRTASETYLTLKVQVDEGNRVRFGIFL